MSGQLVGEVLDAAEAGQLDKLSRPAFCALMAVAERCHHSNRQGTVRRARIQAAIFERNGYRTASRAIRELKDAGLIRVVRRGYKAPNGDTASPIYELVEFGTPKVSEASDEADEAWDIQVSQATDKASDTQVSQASDEAWDKIDEAWDKIDEASDTQGVHHDGSIDGTNTGKEPPYPPKHKPPPSRRITTKTGRDKALAKIRHANQTARSPDAHAIVAAYSDSLPVPIGLQLQAEIGVQVDHCLIAGISTAAIAAGLEAWTQSDSWAPSQIPKFVHKANNAKPCSTADDRVRQTQALKASVKTWNDTSDDWSPFNIPAIREFAKPLEQSR
jgi:hypothetical protein